jgi:hypothetical protein
MAGNHQERNRWKAMAMVQPHNVKAAATALGGLGTARAGETADLLFVTPFTEARLDALIHPGHESPFQPIFYFLPIHTAKRIILLVTHSVRKYLSEKWMYQDVF